MNAKPSNSTTSIFQYDIQNRGGKRPTSFLSKMNKIVPWQEIADELEPVIYDGKKGRPGFPVVLLVKTLFLAQWYDLSDPELEDQIRDRISFQKFLNVSEDIEIPDETTFCRFRNKLVELNAAKELFDVISEIIEDQGVLVKRGTIVDATIVHASKGKKREDGSTTRDQDASFTRKGGDWHCGYKAHIATDTQGKFIKETRFTTAKVHDKNVLDDLTEKETKAIFGDKAYRSHDFKRKCRKECIFYGIIDQKEANQPLSSKQENQNYKKSSVRCRVEHPFAWMKRFMNYRRVRYRGLEKNSHHFVIIATAYNLKRLASVLDLMPKPS